MQAASPPTYHPEPVFRGFEKSVERTLGADMRLIYGFAVPMLMVIGLIIVLALSPTTWLVVTILILELAALGIVLTGFIGVLSDDEDAKEDLQ
jgi:hypothetical protein